jgi:hypothetical protein
VPVSREEERAKILRAIARGGFSPEFDNDGNTAEHLENWARELDAPSDHQTWMASAARGFAAIGRAMRSRRRRWYHRMALRVKLRWLGLVPVVAMGWCSLEVRALVAQTPPDSLYQLPTVRAALGTWAPTRIWCVTRAADYGTLLVLVSVTPADSTRCQRSDGTRAPLFIDAEECPPATFDPGQFPFVIVRCAADDYRKFQRRQPERRTQ